MNASIRPEMRAVAANQVYDTERDRYMMVIVLGYYAPSFRPFAEFALG